MPEIVWVGNISDSNQEEIKSDMRRLLNFFAEELAIESDFSETTILLFDTVDAAVEHAESRAEPRFVYSPEHLRSTLETGWQAEAQPWGFFQSACGWEAQLQPNCHGNRGATLAHEWFHVLQDQLSTRHPHLAPTWMSEGSAAWLNWRLPPEFDQASFDDQRDGAIDRVAQTREPLSAGENGFYSWIYDLGAVVTDRLVEAHGIDAILDFDRHLYPQVVGADRRWIQAPTWHEAFETVFGLSVAAFYDEFAAWRTTVATSNQSRAIDPNDVKLAGTVHYSDGSPAVGLLAFAQEYVGEIPIALERTTVVDEEGAFTLHVASETIQRLRITHGDCELWLAKTGLVVGRAPEGEYGELDTRDLSMLELVIPEHACENKLSVNLERLRGDSREIDMLLNSEDGEQWFELELSANDVYTRTVYAPEPGRYRLRVTLDGCNLWYHPDGVVASRGRGAPVALSKQPVSVQVRIPEDLCRHRISGRLTDEAGAPLDGVTLFAADGDMYGFAWTEEDGKFRITLPDAGNYNLYFHVDGCSIDYSLSGATNEWDEITWITVADADVTGIEFVVPSDPASLCE